jgi:signal transduction histidine kinase
MFRKWCISLFVAILIFCSFAAKAYDKDTVLNIAYIENYIYLRPLLKCNILKTTNGENDLAHALTLPNLKLPPLNAFNHTRQRFYRFSITNTSRYHADTVLLYNGLLIDADVYESDSIGKPFKLIKDKIKTSAAPISSDFECVPLVAPTGSVKHFMIVPKITYYNWFNWRPLLVRKVSLNDLVFDHIIKPNFNYLIITLILMGMMLIMFGYPAIKFFYTGKKEFLFNAIYVACFIAYFGYFLLLDFSFNITLHKGLNFVPHFLQMTGHMAQMYFAFHFLQLKKQQPLLYKLAKWLIAIMVVYLIADTTVAFSTAHSRISEQLFMAIRALLLVFALFTIITFIKWKFYLAQILAWGLIAMTCFSLAAIVYNTLIEPPHWLKFIGGPLNLFFIGILVELFFFRLALGRKEFELEKEKLKAIQALQLDNERKELEKSLAIVRSQEDERNRIAKEIHDDIGSGLTSIRLTSEIALAKNENKSELERISATSDELISNLNEIVWSINSKNDRIPNMLAYIRRYVVNFFESSGISVTVSMTDDLPDVTITGEERRNIFMVVKECLNNIVKHSNAISVVFTSTLQHNKLVIAINDNGIGFVQTEVLPFKNGIRNITERMEVIGGTAFIETSDAGTTITLSYPITGL